MQLPVHVSRLVDRNPLARQATECGHLWTLRDRAVRSPRYRMQHLVALDRRIEEHRTALTLGGDEAWAACVDALNGTGPGSDEASDDAQSPHDSAGIIFAAALMAFSARRADYIRLTCDAALASAAGQRALIAALAWLPFEPLAPILQQFSSAPDARLRRVAMRALGLHRRDPFDALKPALLDDDPGVVAAAARGLGESRRRDAVPLLASRSSVAPEPARFGMASSLLLLGCRDALPLLALMAEDGGAQAMEALGLVLRSAPTAEGRQLLSRLSSRAGAERLVVAGTGMLGDPLAVPWLIAKMQDPALCRIAGEAFSLITGADLADPANFGQGEPSAAGEAEPAASSAQGEIHPDDVQLPKLDLERVGAWWQEHGDALTKGSRHLCSQSITPASLLGILQSGDQRQRRAAALEWALLDDDQPVFDVRQRSDGQLRALRACS
ncbi:conserved hypothetical protein [Roseateles sp. YR242]|uniref:TIGR02270 family protein n=1 Tax=Roseateles sp. YR242 TaxID=1855305 RepID=UPI0008C7D3C4|nr:TIGR02270 family protein [Roseateles sp. YR242]SEL36177.1 conserved hypothetical protein [Roseateles sp. YR242]